MRKERIAAKKRRSAEARLRVFTERPGPEKQRGESPQEYRARVKRHDHVMEKQIARAEIEIKRLRNR